jgi:hypothetical protein
VQTKKKVGELTGDMGAIRLVKQYLVLETAMPRRDIRKRPSAHV